MKLMNLIVIFPVFHLCQADHNQTGQNSSLPEVFDKDRNQTELNPEPIVTRHAGGCSWGLRTPGGGDSSSSAALSAESRDRLALQTCRALGCGGVYSWSGTAAPPNSSCLTGCSYRDRRLQGCSPAPGTNCTVLSEVVCGRQAVRLAGGGGRCAGRVELWRDGAWGTVCDDGWGLGAGHVVCGQLRCGHALAVSGQGGAYPPGRGPIYLDELNCTGAERSLWECPAQREGHDCGHKEDAAVVCSEMRAVRLMGGLDRCSGKVEIHRNGSWGTVCRYCWDTDMASLVCSMLGCGPPNEIFGFDPRLTAHNNGTVWYYVCRSGAKDLWDCTEIANPPFCLGSRAAALYCNGSLGLQSTHSAPTSTAMTMTNPATTASESFRFLPPVSPELLGCFLLSLVLLAALITNAALCCRHRRRETLSVQRRQADMPSLTEHQASEHRETIDLIKITSGPTENHAPSDPRAPWPQLSSTSVHTDYDASEPDRSAHLSTFRNSKCYRPDMGLPLARALALHSLTEEAVSAGRPSEVASGPLASHHHFLSANGYGRVSGPNTATPSMDSFESSSTSSGECYENTGPQIENLLTAEERNPIQSKSALTYSHDQGQSEGSSDGGPVYSPVSPDPDPPSLDSDYDDIEN